MFYHFILSRKGFFKSHKFNHDLTFWYRNKDNESYLNQDFSKFIENAYNDPERYLNEQDKKTYFGWLVSLANIHNYIIKDIDKLFDKLNIDSPNGSRVHKSAADIYTRIKDVNHQLHLFYQLIRQNQLTEDYAYQFRSYILDYSELTPFDRFRPFIILLGLLVKINVNFSDTTSGRLLKVIALYLTIMSSSLNKLDKKLVNEDTLIPMPLFKDDAGINVDINWLTPDKDYPRLLDYLMDKLIKDLHYSDFQYRSFPELIAHIVRITTLTQCIDQIAHFYIEQNIQSTEHTIKGIAMRIHAIKNTFLNTIEKGHDSYPENFKTELESWIDDLLDHDEAYRIHEMKDIDKYKIIEDDQERQKIKANVLEALDNAEEWYYRAHDMEVNEEGYDPVCQDKYTAAADELIRAYKEMHRIACFK